MIFLFCSTKKSGACDEAKETNDLKYEGKSTGKSPKKPRRPLKRFGEMSEEDVLKLKLPEHLDYNLDILFVSILTYLIWQSGTSEKKEWIRNIFINHERVSDINFPGLVLDLEN